MAPSSDNERRVTYADEEPMTLGEKISHRMDQFKEMISSGCCSCASKCPSVAVVFITAVILLLLISSIPLTMFLTSSTQKLSSDSRELPQVIRRPKFWPKVDKIQIDNEEESGEIRAISMMTSLFPPNVSSCSGFGFSCADSVHSIIPTSKRCDGIYDCADKSDEQNCKSCQTIFSCVMRPTSIDSLTSSRTKKWKKPQPSLICLTSSQLCDGVQHCPDGSDETLMCKSKCDEDEFRCKKQNLCLPKSAKCNGVFDCDDGSDEKNCESCEKSAHKCGEVCIKASEICDGVAQCADGSDEKECDCKSCSGSKKALCDDGTCISRRQICDGKMDCADGMDETDCPGSCLVKGIKEKRITCSDGHQYTEKEACSGNHEECSMNCTKCDTKVAFQCPSVIPNAPKKCIARRMVCDGVMDCSDGADEKDCQCDMESGRQFKCDSKCVDVSKRCDGVADCYDMTDERNCNKCSGASLKCAIDKSCLPKSARCDGVVDCSDGSDEKNCTCEECVGAHSNTYMCDGSSRCLRRDEVCAPYSMCPNATRADKAFCAALVLKRNNNIPW